MLRMASCSGSMNALRMSGLFIVTMRIGPSASTISCSGTSYIGAILSSSRARRACSILDGYVKFSGIVPRWTCALLPRPRRSATQVRAFLAEHLPADWPGIGALAGRRRGRVRHRLAADAARARAARPRLADRVRRRRADQARAGRAGRGVRAGEVPLGPAERHRHASRWSATRCCGGGPRSRSGGSCPASSRGRTRGARGSPSRSRIRPRGAEHPCRRSTATSG